MSILDHILKRIYHYPTFFIVKYVYILYRFVYNLYRFVLLYVEPYVQFKEFLEHIKIKTISYFFLYFLARSVDIASEKYFSSSL